MLHLKVRWQIIVWYTDDEEMPPLSGPDDPKAGETEREAEEEEYREISEDGWEDVLGR